MAVSGYTIWHINQEFPQYAHMKDLGSLGAHIIGRPFGQTIWISEFYGRSNILIYYPSFPAYPANFGYYGFDTAHGHFVFGASSHEWNGNNSQTLEHAYVTGQNPTAWAKFIDVHIPWMGYTFSKASFEQNGYSIGWGGGNFGGGPMTYRFYG